MSTEEVHVMQVGDKNATERPEADEDARTESSDGSNSHQQWEAADSEDEFEDAMAPPFSTSSTSSMLLVFDGGAPPLSGVYQDALEATEEQVAAALGSTSSDGRQFTIPEENEEHEEEDVETEVRAVVQGIVETAVAARKDASDEAYDEVSTEYKLISAQENEVEAEETNDFDVVEETQDIEEEGFTEAIAPECTDRDQEVRVGRNSAVESDAGESAEEELAGETTTEDADEESLTVAEESEEKDSTDPSEAEVRLQDGPEEFTGGAGGTEFEQTDVQDELVPASEGAVAMDIAESESPVALEESVAITPKEEEAVDIVEEDEVAEESVIESDETAVVKEVEVDAAVDSNNVEVTTGDEATRALDSIADQTGMDTSAIGPAEESEEVADQESETVEDAGPVDVVGATESIKDEGDAAPVDQAIVVDSTNDVATEDAALTEPVAEEVCKTEEATVQVSAVEDESGANLEGGDDLEEGPSQPEELADEPSDEEAAEVDVEEVVLQVANELVAAVQSEQDNEKVLVEADATIEDEVTTVNAVVDAQEAGAVQEQTPAEEEAETAANAAEPANQPAKSEEDDVVLGLLSRLEPSSMTTTTTTIEPFSLTTDSVEVHLPTQRWIYEVYGFSIENRVVYYHIHKTDRRTGIRDPPVLKRFTDFHQLELQLLDSCLHAAADMPRIPKPHLGTVFRGYKSKKTIEIREKAFRAVLRCISQYPELHSSRAFERFIATSRAAPGAGWT